jgi:hypothetical protein
MSRHIVITAYSKIEVREWVNLLRHIYIYKIIPNIMKIDLLAQILKSRTQTAMQSDTFANILKCYHLCIHKGMPKTWRPHTQELLATICNICISYKRSITTNRNAVCLVYGKY